MRREELDIHQNLEEKLVDEEGLEKRQERSIAVMPSHNNIVVMSMLCSKLFGCRQGSNTLVSSTGPLYSVSMGVVGSIPGTHNKIILWCPVKQYRDLQVFEV